MNTVLIELPLTRIEPNLTLAARKLNLISGNFKPLHNKKNSTKYLVFESFAKFVLSDGHVTLTVHWKSNSHKSGASESNCTNCTVHLLILLEICRAGRAVSTFPPLRHCCSTTSAFARKVDIYCCSPHQSSPPPMIQNFCAPLASFLHLCHSALYHSFGHALLTRWRQKGAIIVLWKDMLWLLTECEA